MKQVLSMVFLLVISVALYAAASPKDVKTIHAARKAFNEAIAKQDIEAMRSFLAEDYVITISNGEIFRSRETHIESFAEHFKQYPDALYVRNTTGIQVSKIYPHAIERGTWVGTRTTDNGALKNSGDYTAAWKRTDMGWVIYSEIFMALLCNGKDC